MPFCLRCDPILCDGLPGVTSITINTSSSVNIVDTGCVFSSSSVFGNEESVPGPIKGTITINAYAFASGQDRWNNLRCKGTAQASQNVIQKKSGQALYLIPSKNHTAQITGDVGGIATIDVIASTESIMTNVGTGGIVLGTRLGVDIGRDFKYFGSPFPINIPDTSSYTILGIECCFLSSFNYSVDFPTQPATASYTFQFVKPID